MFYNLKIMLRKLVRGGIYSVINIGGLAIGMAAAMLIMLWIYHQWSYDRFHEKKNQIYSVWSYNETYPSSWEWTSTIIGPTLKEDYADVVEMTRYFLWQQLVTYGDKSITFGTALADPGFLTMFSFPMLEGDVHSALSEPYSIVLTEDAAKRLFGDEDPLGKDVLIRAKFMSKVTGIIANPPENSRFQFDALVPFVTNMKENGSYQEYWSNYTNFTFVELAPGAKGPDVTASIKNIIRQHTNNEDITQPFLHPMPQWHLYTDLDNGKIIGGRIETVRLFGLIALLILLIACINFMNLSTARSTRSAREVGIRKVMGARRKRLVWQFLSESTLVAAIAAVFATIIVWLCLPVFSNLMNERLGIHFTNIGLWLALLGFVLFTGLLAGSYPAFYLSSFLPVRVLKGLFKGGNKLVTPRKLLIVTQFTFAIILIISTVVIHRQIQYGQGRTTGYDKDQLIYIENLEQMEKKHVLIRQDLLRSGAAVSVTRTMSPMTENWSNTWRISWPGKDPNDRTVINCFCVDADWAKTTGVTILQGRDIDVYTYPTDSFAVLLNETAVKVMGFKDPIGQIIHGLGGGNKDLQVVGVVKDFLLQSPYEPIEPMVVSGPIQFFGMLHVKLNGANRTADNLAKITEILKVHIPEYPFVYKFVDESYARKFADEQRTGTLASWFAGLAIFISCLGLFGLSAYMAENRRKEISVRKVLGASVVNITSLLSREFLTLVLVSLAIAIPVAWWVMNKWLTGYTYRANIPWWLLTAVAALTIGIALFTVSWQAIKAATANPVKNLKTE